MSNSPEYSPVLIVLRHGQDLPTDAENDQYKKDHDGADIPKDEEYKYFKDHSSLYPQDSQLTTPIPGGKVTVPWHRLSDEGIARAKAIGQLLPQWIEKKKYKVVTRVITKDPNGKSRTQNPFETILPFMNNIEKDQKGQRPNGKDVKVDLLDMPENGLPFSSSSLISEFSTVICWDRQGLWNDDNDNKTYILQHLSRDWDDKVAKGELSRPHKGDSFYIFTDPKEYESGHWNFSVEQLSWQQIADFVAKN
ncbi:MAG: hypothetical protein HEP71_27205 [Roseivirga sp.]|nr:hypothetical protein [Roseivirga sp.]